MFRTGTVLKVVRAGGTLVMANLTAVSWTFLERCRVGVVGLVLLAAACGSQQPSSLATSATPSHALSTTAGTVSPTAGTVLVTDGANGSTVQLRVGQRLEVRLSQDTYDPPVSSADTYLVRRSSTGGYPSAEPADAVFEAVAHGTADVTATTDAACFHTEPRCLMPTRLWVVHVTVR